MYLHSVHFLKSVSAFLLFLCLCMGIAKANEPSISATLSSNSTSVTEPVELQVTIQGSQKPSAPEVRVDGLDIKYAGQSSSSSVQLQGGRIESVTSIIYTYDVTPRKEGIFTIPSLQVTIDGKKYSTEPLRLTVSNNGQSAGTGNGSDSSDTRFAFAEWVLPKTTAYVGEAIPAELRLYIDPKIQCQLPQMPSATGEGLTVQKLTQPQQRQVTKDGREMILAIFKTAITPVKAGELTLQSADINVIAVLPAKKQRGSRIPGFPDVFNDPFFNSAFPQQQQVTIRAGEVAMNVKPLPLTGKPKDFSGAVGQFTMETQAAPLRVHAGDPVTVTAVVKGIGSFDRMNAPVLDDQPGWRTYPPSGKFKADDEVGISGAKTFEIAAIPESGQSELPKLTFAFFNPSSEKYETLESNRIPLTVEGTPAVAPTPAPVAVATPSATPAATPTPKASDIQYLRVDAGHWGVSFEPAWHSRTFWLLQLIPFTALLALTGWQCQRARNADGTARRLATLRHAKAEAVRILQNEKTPPGDFYDAAIRVLQLETALGCPDREPGTVDADMACASRLLDCETMEGVRRIFAAHDELRYAGAGAWGASSASVEPDRRAMVLQILEQFEKSHA